MAALRLPKMITISPTGKHNATLFFFHGSGSSGADVKEWLDILNGNELKFPNIKVVYPTAPSQPYTPMDGLPSNVWFDRSRISIKAPELKESLEKMCKATSGLIEEEVKNGIPENRIVVGGFSMGGALAFHLAYRYKKSLGGCVAISSFLNDNSIVYEGLTNSEKTPPLLQFHGLADAMVPFQWGDKTYNNLKELGVEGELIKLPGVEHEIVKTEVVKFKDWLSEILPESP